MSYKDLQKDDRILEIVKHLFDKFGDDCFKIRDYWDADLCAIGLSDNSEKYLFYISTYNKQEEAGLTRNPTFRIFNAFGVGDRTRLRKPRSNANTYVVRNCSWDKVNN
jgi:hypothetical protein